MSQPHTVARDSYRKQRLIALHAVGGHPRAIVLVGNSLPGVREKAVRDETDRIRVEALGATDRGPFVQYLVEPVSGLGTRVRSQFDDTLGGIWVTSGGTELPQEEPAGVPVDERFGEALVVLATLDRNGVLPTTHANNEQLKEAWGTMAQAHVGIEATLPRVRRAQATGSDLVVTGLGLDEQGQRVVDYLSWTAQSSVWVRATITGDRKVDMASYGDSPEIQAPYDQGRMFALKYETGSALTVSAELALPAAREMSVAN